MHAICLIKHVNVTKIVQFPLSSIAAQQSQTQRLIVSSVLGKRDCMGSVVLLQDKTNFWLWIKHYMHCPVILPNMVIITWRFCLAPMSIDIMSNVHVLLVSCIACNRTMIFVSSLWEQEMTLLYAKDKRQVPRIHVISHYQTFVEQIYNNCVQLLRQWSLQKWNWVAVFCFW